MGELTRTLKRRVDAKAIADISRHLVGLASTLAFYESERKKITTEGGIMLNQIERPTHTEFLITSNLTIRVAK